jgi:hypothetical protein
MLLGEEGQTDLQEAQTSTTKCMQIYFLLQVKERTELIGSRARFLKPEFKVEIAEGCEVDEV